MGELKTDLKTESKSDGNLHPLEIALEQVRKVNDGLTVKYENELDQSEQLRKIIANLTVENEKLRKNENLHSVEICELKLKNKKLEDKNGDKTSLIDQINTDRESFIVQQ